MADAEIALGDLGRGQAAPGRCRKARRGPSRSHRRGRRWRARAWRSAPTAGSRAPARAGPRSGGRSRRPAPAASPSDGSSSTRRRGFAMRPRAITSICCCPPERLATGSSSRSSSTGKSAHTSRMRAGKLALAERVAMDIGAEAQILGDASGRRTPGAPPAPGRCRAAPAPCGLQPVDALALEQDLARAHRQQARDRS